MKETWLQNRFPSLYQQGWNLFAKEMGDGKSDCTLYGFIDPAHEKKNLLLLHGLGTSWNSWVNSVEKFTDTYNVYIFDMPWNCAQPCPFLTLEELVDWTLAMLKKAGISTPIVMTHSYAGIVMLNALGKMETGFIDKLAICSLSWMCGGSEENIVHLLNTFLDNIFELVYSSILAGIRPETEPDTIRYMCERVMATLDRQTLRDYLNIGHQDALPFPAKLDIPLVLIAGEDDFLAPKEDSIAVNQKIKGSQYICIPKAKHFPMVEAKEAFYEVVRRFCKEQSIS